MSTYTPKNLLDETVTPQGDGGSSYTPKNLLGDSTTFSQTTETPTKKKTKVGAFISGIGTGLGRDNVANLRETGSLIDRVIYNSMVTLNPKLQEGPYKTKDDAIKYYQEKQAKIDAYKQKTEDNLKAKLGDDYGSLGFNMGRGLGQGITQIGTAFIPVVGPGLAVTANTSLVAAGAKQDYRDAYETTLKDTGDKNLALKNARIVGTVSGIVNLAETVVPGKILFAEKLMGKGFYNGLKQFAKTAVTESLTEGLQDSSVSLAKKFTYDKNADPIKDGLYSALVSLPTSLLFGGIDVASNKLHQAKLQEVAKEMVSNQVRQGVEPNMAVDNVVNIISTMNGLGKEDVFQNIGSQVLEQSENAKKLSEEVAKMQQVDPTFIPDKETMNTINEFIRQKNVYDLTNAEELGLIKQEDGSSYKFEVIPYSEDEFKVKVTETTQDGIETVSESEKIYNSKDVAIKNIIDNLTPDEIEVGTGPMFRMREPIDNNNETVDTTISDTGTFKPEQVDYIKGLIKKTYGDNIQIMGEQSRPSNKGTVGTVRDTRKRNISEALDGTVRAMEEISGNKRGIQELYRANDYITNSAEKLIVDKVPVAINNISLGILNIQGLSTDVTDTIKSLFKQKNNPITHIQVTNDFQGRKDFDAIFSNGNTLVLNPDSFNTLTKNIIIHEFSHAWFQSISDENKSEFITNLETQKEVVKKGWEISKVPHNGYYYDEKSRIQKAIQLSTNDKILTEQIINKTGFKNQQISLDNMIDLSFDLDNQIEIINKELSDKGFVKIRFNKFNSIIINEHIAVIAESSEELESDNEVINNLIEMSDDGTYDFGTALQDKGQAYLRRSDIPTVEMQMEYNKTFAIDEDALTNRINQGKEYVSILNEQIQEHPGKQIANRISRTEGQFIEDQFAFYDNPKNAKEKLHNERASKLGGIVASLIEEYGVNGEYKGDFGMANVAQTMYAEYQALLKSKQNTLEALRDDKKALKQQTSTEKLETKTLADNAISALKRSYIPPSERKLWMEKATEIGTDKVKYLEYVKEISARTEEIMITQAITFEKAKMRSEIMLLRQVNDISPKIITDIKKSLSITEPVNKLSLKQLMSMTEELKSRVEFIQKNGYNVSMSAMRKPSREQQDAIAKVSYENGKKIKPKLKGTIDRLIGSFKNLQTVTERLNKILPQVGVLYKKMQYDIQTDLNNKYTPVVNDFLKSYEKLSGLEQESLKSYLNNKDYESAFALFKEKGLDIQILKDTQEMLKDIYNKLRAAGVDVKELNGFFPRLLTREGKEMMKERLNAYDAAIREKEGQLGRKLTLEELANLQTSMMIKGITMESLLTLSDGRYGQSRNIEFLNQPEFLQLYDNPVNALESYVAGAINLYHQRAFMGKLDPTFDVNEMKGKNHEEVISKLAQALVENNTITMSELEEVQSIMSSLLKPTEYSAFKDAITSFTYAMGLGQLTASVTQASEIIPTLIRFGLPKNFKLDAADVGVSSRYEVDIEKSSKLSSLIMKPMMFGDKNISAKVLVNSVVNYLQKIANGKINEVDLENLTKNIAYVYGKENTGNILRQIKNYDFGTKETLPPEIGMLVYLYSSELRVIDRSDKIKFLIDNPFFGVFKNFSIKTIGALFTSGNKLISEGIKRKDYSLVAAGVYRKSALLTTLVAASAGAQMIKDLIKGNTDDFDKDQWLLNYFLNGFYKLFFLSQYQIDNVDRIGGPGTILVDTILPAPIGLPTGLVDNAIKDIKGNGLFDLEETKTLKRIPLIGDIIDISFQRD